MAIAVIIVSLGMGAGKVFVEIFKDRDIKKKNPGISFFIPPFLKVFLFLFLPLPCYLSSSSSQFLFFLLAIPLHPSSFPPSSSPLLLLQALRPCHSSVVCLPPRTSRRRHDESRSLASPTAATVSSKPPASRLLLNETEKGSFLRGVNVLVRM